MREPILVINAGSSSVKFSLFETEDDRSLSVGRSGQVESIGTAARFKVVDARGDTLADHAVDVPDCDAAVAAIHRWLADEGDRGSGLAGIGHRVVHGGGIFSEPVAVDDEIIAQLEALTPLAPLHQPHNIAAIRFFYATAPKVRQVACFDTAFHRTMPLLEQVFALPRDLTARGIRRYGFHGISYEYILSALPRMAPTCVGRKLIVAHLGSGASMCAIDHGRSVATTMAFTPLDGLPMGTRAGALDPGVILYLLQHEGMDAEAIQNLLYQRSGLLGVSGLSGDMRTLLDSDLPAARDAIDLFVYRTGRELGSLVAALNGLDALIFTAGIGENAPEIRARICRDAGWLGIAIDNEANAKGGPRISSHESAIPAWVIPTDENLMIARHTRRLLDAT